MPDSERSIPRRPATWAEAFAALPTPAPPADGWASVAVALDAQPFVATPTRRRWYPRHRFALAAALALAVLLPAAWLRDAADEAVPELATLPAQPHAVIVQPEPAPRRPASEAASPTVAANDAALAEADRIASAPSPGVVAQPPPESDVRQPKRKPVPRSEVRIVAAADKEASTDKASERVAGSLDSGEAAVLQQLQSESARLETVLAFARDGDAGSAAATVLASELDGRIGLIDAGLSQAGLAPDQRLSLWRERVDTLRDLAGIQATERWLAANGRSYDGALVSVD